MNNSLQHNGYVSVNVRRFKDYHKTTDEKLYSEWTNIVNMKKNLLTNPGRDAFHRLTYLNDDSVTPSRGFGWLALTESTFTPLVTDTTLAGEITVNGLNRTDAINKLHTNSTNSSTIDNTFTAVAAFSTGVKAAGLFNAASGGVLSHEGTFTNTVLAIFDQIKVTFTLNLG
jgi:hypothetical protein